MNSSKHLIIFGDFNGDLLNANLHNLKDLMLLNNLRNLISEPTRITDTSSTLLDPIFISDEIIVLDSGFMQSDRSMSDYAMTYLHDKHDFKVSKSYKRKV